MALAALTERQPLTALAAHYQLATVQITRWKLQLRQHAAQIFAETPAAAVTVPDAEPLQAAFDRLQMENALPKKRWGYVRSPAVRLGRPTQSQHSVQACCQALGLTRSNFYCQPLSESARSLELMRLLDEEFIQYIFKTVLGLRDHLRLAGHVVNAEVRAPHRTPNGPRARLPQIVLAVV